MGTPGMDVLNKGRMGFEGYGMNAMKASSGFASFLRALHNVDSAIRSDMLNSRQDRSEGDVGWFYEEKNRSTLKIRAVGLFDQL